MVQRIYKSDNKINYGAKIGIFRKYIETDLAEDIEEKVVKVVDVKEAKDELVYFTDSEDDESVGEREDPLTEKDDPITAKKAPDILESHSISLKEKTHPIKCPGLSNKQLLKQEFDRRRKQFHSSCNNTKPVTGRAALLISLNQKVHEKAYENLCKIEKVKRQDLELRLEISNRCR